MIFLSVQAKLLETKMELALTEETANLIIAGLKGVEVVVEDIEVD